MEMLGPRRRDAGSGLALPALRPRAPSPTLLPKQPVLSGLAYDIVALLPSINDGPSRPSRRFTRTCLVEAPTHHAPASDLALRAAATTPQRPSPPSAVPPSYHLPPPRRRAVRSSTPTRQPMLLGGRRRGPRLCRLAAGPAQPSSLPSRQPVRTTVQPPCRPRDAPNHQQAQQSRRAGRVATAPAFSPTPTRLGYAVASASSRSQRCIGEPAARRVSTSAAAVTGGPTSAGRANHALQTAPSCVCPSATPALVGLRPAGAHQRGCAVVPLAHAPRWQLEAAAAAPECQPITLLQPSESTSLLLPRHLPLAFDQQPTNVCAVPSCRPRHHIVEAAVP